MATTWSGSSKNLWLIGGVLVLDAAILIANDPDMGLIAVLAAILVLVVNFSFVRVVVTPERVRVSFLFGWPSRVISRGDIVHVAVEDVRPRRFGGWGLRSGKVFLARSGPGLVLRTITGGTVTATVDDAPAGAAALSATSRLETTA